MLANTEVCEKQAEISREDLENEIVSVWLLMFRSVEALNTALCVLMEKYKGNVVCDFCRYYVLVLSEMLIEVKR